MNPGGSVKDRAALGIIEEAEERGLLKPGATIVEGTTGNTGIGLAIIGRARGHPTLIIIPDNQSPEKSAPLRMLGAEVIAVPEKPYRDPQNYAASGRISSITRPTATLSPPAQKSGSKPKARPALLWPRSAPAALKIIGQLLREEGFFLGLSSGINAGAVRYARERGPGQTIVTILCDSGHKYQSTLYDAEWLARKQLDPGRPLESIFDPR